MIFLTVGTQLPFDRLVAAVDEWAATGGVPVFAQTAAGKYRPRHCEHADYVPPSLADDLFRKADLIVSHAGMGSILTALKYRKRILILPRKAALGEHRNEHQLATARWLGRKPGVFVAHETDDVTRLLSARDVLETGDCIGDYADPALLARLRDFVSR
ncbi:MAG TPA: glycosyltransferase [Noviherbaspirillum sp.]|jgi:UDP-N-acetylglucosamine transferase subunit ALG13|uniref:glycosyltransferase n=1 Tax=Noviherbaspirillum sp. TaxID=1926288 RepID=UPI002F9552FC